MCLVVYPNAFLTTRNGAVVFISKGPGKTLVGLIVKAPESVRRRFPQGTRVVYQNDMGHVLCAGSPHDKQDECDLHELDAVKHLGSKGGVYNVDPLLKDLTRTLAKLKGKAGLVVMKHEEDSVVEVTTETVKANAVTEKKMVLFKNLEPGQKFKHSENGGIYKRTHKALDLTRPGYSQIGITEDSHGNPLWTFFDDEVILVA